MINNPGNTITIYNTASCVKEAHNKSSTPINIHSAFKKTGIFPVYRDFFFLSAVTSRIEVSNENSNSETIVHNLNLSQNNLHSGQISEDIIQ